MNRISLCTFFAFSVLSTAQAASPVITEIELLALTTKAGQPICYQACFASEIAAHLAASERWLPVSLNFRREISWRVYLMSDSTFAYSYPAAGEREATQSQMPPLASGVTYISAGHVHWDNVHRFSAQDWNWVVGNQKPLFLMSNEGILRRALPHRARRMARSGGLATRPAVDFRGEQVAIIKVALHFQQVDKESARP